MVATQNNKKTVFILILSLSGAYGQKRRNGHNLFEYLDYSLRSNPNCHVYQAVGLGLGSRSNI